MVCRFLFLQCLSWFSYRVILTLLNEFRLNLQVFIFYFLKKSLWRIHVNYFWMICRIHRWSRLGMGFFAWSFNITPLISLPVIRLFRLSIYSWVSFGNLYIPRNLFHLSYLIVWCTFIHSILFFFSQYSFIILFISTT